MKKLFGPHNELKMGFDPKHNISARFKNTRIVIFPGFAPNDKEPDIKGNMIQFCRLQTDDQEALCLSRKRRVFKGRALTNSFVWLTDEALYALYLMLGHYFKDKAKRMSAPTWTDFEELKGFIATWPSNLTDVELANLLNEQNLPMEFWQQGFDYYKTLNK